MSKIKKITFEYEDEITYCEGEEAQYLLDSINNLTVMASMRAGNQNPFDKRKVKWVQKIINKPKDNEIK